MGARGDGAPAMAAGMVDQCGVAGERARGDADLAADRAREREAALVDGDDQAVAVPFQVAGADRQMMRRTFGLPAFGHRPGGWLAVEGDVERAVAKRVGGAVSSGEAVIGREDAAEEGDQGDAVGAIVAERVDIPPDIAVRRDRAVEARSSIRADAASRPERAAIGTPGPGWVLPPAR